jgi:hypothetical protein
MLMLSGFWPSFAPWAAAGAAEGFEEAAGSAAGIPGSALSISGGVCWGRVPENGGGRAPPSLVPFEHPKIAIVAALVTSLLRAILLLLA